MKLGISSTLSGQTVTHQVMSCGMVFVIALLWLDVVQADCLRVRRSTTAMDDMHDNANLNQELKRLLSKTSPNSTDREGLELLFRVIDDTRNVKEPERRRAYALVERLRPSNDSHGDQSEYRKIAIEDAISLKRAPQEAGTNMSMSFEGNSLSKPAIHWTVLYNDTTILVVRGANKYYYWRFAQTTIALVIFGFIVVGNLSILYRLKSYRRRRSNVNYFIVQLAIADLLVGVFNVTLDSVLRTLQTFTWGLFACRASKYISSLFIYSSTNLLVALSIDRWEAVVKPLAFTRNRSRGYQLVIGSWLLALVSALPVAYYSKVQEVDGLVQCWIDLDKFGWRVYLIYLTSLLLVIPTLFIAICYAHIVYTIWSKARQVNEQQRQRCEQQQDQSSKEVNDNALKGGANERAVALDRTRKSCLKSRFDRGDFKRSCTIEIGQDDVGAGEHGQPAKFNGQTQAALSGPGCQQRGPAPKTKVAAEGLTEEVEFGQVAGGGKRSPSDTLEVNDNALASLPSSASSTSSRSSSSSSTIGVNSRASPLEVIANDLASAMGTRKVAAISGEPSAIGGAHLDTSLTRAPDATIDSNQSEASQWVTAVEVCKLADDGKHSNRDSPMKAFAEDGQRRSSRRALSEDLGGAKPTASLPTNVNAGPTCTQRALLERCQRRRSSHMGAELQTSARSHNVPQQSNSMISCDNLVASNAMSKIARKSFKKLASGRGGKSTSGGHREFVAQQHGSGVIPKARIKTIKMTLVIVIAYILCWTPFLILNILNVFDIFNNNTNASRAIMTLTQSLAHLNSAVNPIIFWLFSSKRNASDSKVASRIIGNGQMRGQRKQAPASEDASIESEAGCLVGLLRGCWARLRWLMTCFNLCGCLSPEGAARQRYQATDSRMFDRTTTTTNFSQTSSRHQQQRSGGAI